MYWLIPSRQPDRDCSRRLELHRRRCAGCSSPPTTRLASIRRVLLGLLVLALSASRLLTSCAAWSRLPPPLVPCCCFVALLRITAALRLYGYFRGTLLVSGLLVYPAVADFRRLPAISERHPRSVPRHRTSSNGVSLVAPGMAHAAIELPSTPGRITPAFFAFPPRSSNHAASVAVRSVSRPQRGWCSARIQRRSPPSPQHLRRRRACMGAPAERHPPAYPAPATATASNADSRDNRGWRGPSKLTAPDRGLPQNQ